MTTPGNKTNDSEMLSYYRERAPIYDKVYSYPERQKDLRYLEAHIPAQLINLDVLEIAAGTGYWTQHIANTAKSILAIDSTAGALKQIHSRPLKIPVQTKELDAYALASLDGEFNAVFAGLWLSHVPKNKLKCFIDSIYQLVGNGARVIFLDNSHAQCSRLPISYTDEDGNTYQDRALDNGQTYRVLKNFPSREELLELVAESGEQPQFLQLENFWLFEYTTR